MKHIKIILFALWFNKVLQNQALHKESKKAIQKTINHLSKKAYDINIPYKIQLETMSQKNFFQYWNKKKDYISEQIEIYANDINNYFRFIPRKLAVILFKKEYEIYGINKLDKKIQIVNDLDFPKFQYFVINKKDYNTIEWEDFTNDKNGKYLQKLA